MIYTESSHSRTDGFKHDPPSTRHNNRNEIPRRFTGNPIRIASVDLLATRQDRIDYLAVNIAERPRIAIKYSV